MKEPQNIEDAFKKLSQLLGEKDPSAQELLRTLTFAHFCDKAPEQKLEEHGWQVRYLFGALPTVKGADLEKAGVVALSNVFRAVLPPILSPGWADYSAIHPSEENVKMAEDLRTFAKESVAAVNKALIRGADGELFSH